MKIVTIGVYGFDEEGFFQAIEEAGVDSFCDIRQRRGVRGAKFAFVNSQRLQGRLAEMGIYYSHRKDLAPTASIRQCQITADKANKIAKRKRASLDPAFITAYQQEILANFDPKSLLNDLPAKVNVVALFCVEREPEACHRSLVAEYLGAELETEVKHIVP